MEKQGIIAKVGDESSAWCHPMVVVAKPKEGIRICVDLTKLNRQIKRPILPTTSPRDAISGIKEGSKYFTTIDAKHGYWQIELDESSQNLTTFMTPQGRYKFLRAPMGLSSTGDEYCRRHSAAIGGHPNMQKVMDDVLLYNNNFEEHVKSVKNFLELCRKHKITLNREKFCFGETKVNFVGYVVSCDGVTPDDKKIIALNEFP